MQKAKKRFFSVTAVLLAVLVALTALLPTAGAAQAATMRSKYTGKSYTHNARFNKLEVLNGVDISAWQEKVNWKKIKNDGIDFAILRAGYGKNASQEDAYFATNFKNATAAGLPVGIYMKSDGLMVIGTGRVTAQTGEVIDPADGILRSGDYIEAINGTPATDKKDMIRAVKEAGNMALTLSVRREGETMDVQMTPVQTQEGDYKLGLWIRDDTQGIGTMTYVCANGAFGALGHGISDGDTGLLVQTSGGELYDTEILGVEKGSFGKPGVMSGVIYYGNQSRLGSVEANTDQGIFGTANPRFLSRVKNPAIPIGYRQDVKKGRACIRSSVSGELKDYEIEIQKIDHSSNRHNKDMVIRVTDPELLSLTGGIVQGMSGSPIIQNGKLIGAVTHVIIQDSTRGYGILVENMLGH